MSSEGNEVGAFPMWFYLFGRNDRYPDPSAEIARLATLDQQGEDVYLKLSARKDAPMKRAADGEVVYLCTRERGRWAILGEASVVGLAIRGVTPPSMVSLYGPTDELHWWRQIGGVRLDDTPRSTSDVGVEELELPSRGQTHVIRIDPRRRNGEATIGPADEAANPLDLLTSVMDAAWDQGRLTPEAIELAISKHRAEHPYER